jgi:ubiquinone/menaquinone biosynthesis C-methylase UbiE
MSLRNLLRDPFKEFIFEIGAGYYTRKLERGPETDIRHEFLQSLDLPKPARGMGLKILDVGCGPGHMAREISEAGYDVTGVDRCRALLRRARASARHTTARFRYATTDDLPFADGSFDLTYATGVIYWVEHLDATLRQIVRVTKPGGRVAFMDPHESLTLANARAYSKRHGLSRRDTRKMAAWATSVHFNRRFREEELRGALTRAGLVNIALEQRMDGMVWFSQSRVAAVAARAAAVAAGAMEVVLAS